MLNKQALARRIRRRLAVSFLGVRLPLLLAICFAGCASRALVRDRASNQARLDAVHYTLTLSPQLDIAAVRVCFDGRPPSRLVPGIIHPRARLHNPRIATDGGPQKPLAMRANTIILTHVQTNECIHYEIELQESARHSFPEARLVHTTDWLYRPVANEREGRRFDLRLQLPREMDASVPFPSAGSGRFLLTESAFLYISYSLFGRFDRVNLKLSGRDVTTLFARDFPAATRRAVRKQLELATAAVATVSGRFPKHALRVLVVPVGAFPSGGPPVIFGQVTRGGGASVLLLVRRDASAEALASDWTIIHELSHLLLPFVKRDDAWLSEGFSTYYQEVLRARVGLASEEQTWQRLMDGVRRTMASETSLAEQAQHMRQRHNYPDVYWGGATYALATAVALHDLGQSLDMVLRELNAERFDDTAPLSASELLSLLDKVSGTDVFQRTATEYVYASPERAAAAQERLLQALGLAECGHRIDVACDRQQAAPNASPDTTRAVRSAVLAADTDVGSGKHGATQVSPTANGAE